MAGTAATVSTEEGDNYAVNAGIYNGKPGYVLVVDGKGNKERAHIGDLMARTAKAIGFRGIVIDGLVRDKIDIKKIGLPVFCRGFIQRKPTQMRSGELNTVISCGGLQVSPGDLVFGDWDGVTVVPRRHIEKVLKKAEEKLESEVKREKLIIKYEEAKELGEKLPDLTPDWLK
jgi:regulator of RNase E activity RraA